MIEILKIRKNIYAKTYMQEKSMQKRCSGCIRVGTPNDCPNKSEATDDDKAELVETSEDSGGSDDSDVSDNSLNFMNQQFSGNNY